jgi:hypothetical protein
MKEIYDGDMKCACGQNMEKKKLRIDGMLVRAWHCGKCREEVLHPGDAQKVLILNKLRHGRPVKVGSLGKRLVVTIPSELARCLSIKKGSVVNARLSDKQEIVLTV